MAKILLVEDDNNLREIYEARLQAEGYEIVSASDGEDALAVAKVEKPQLVISDVMMPKISGFEMLDILRNTDGLADVKVIMLTALGQAEDKTRADQLGADRYLVKSQVTLEDIVKTAHQLLDDEAEPIVADTTPVAAAPSTPVTATPAEPATPAPIVTDQASIAISAAAAVVEPVTVNQTVADTAAEPAAAEKAAMDAQINSFVDQPAPQPAEPVEPATPAPVSVSSIPSEPVPPVPAVDATPEVLAIGTAPSEPATAPSLPPSSDNAATSQSAAEPVTPNTADTTDNTANNDQILADAVQSLGGTVTEPPAAAVERPSEVTAVEVTADPTVGVPVPAPNAPAATPPETPATPAVSTGLGSYLAAGQPATTDDVASDDAADAPAIPPAPTPVMPVAAPEAPAAPVSAESTPTVPEPAVRKKVIQPLESSESKPDINVLLAAEEAKAEPTPAEPVVNGQPVETPGSSPDLTLPEPAAVPNAEPAAQAEPAMPPAQSLTEQPVSNPALQMSPELQAAIVEPPTEGESTPEAVAPAAPVTEPPAPSSNDKSDPTNIAL